MTAIFMAMQLIVGFGILNVWLVRRNRPTPYRGGLKGDMASEFAFYGLPAWTVAVVGISKVTLALIILAGFVFPPLTAVGAAALALFMLVAVVLHLKVGDGLLQTLPALLMLLMCAALALAGEPSLMTTIAGL